MLILNLTQIQEIMKNFFLTFLISICAATAFSQTTISVTFKDLDKSIQKYISKHYGGYTVDKAIQELDADAKLQFSDVYVSKGSESYMLTFDKKDNFVKRAPVAVPAKGPAKVDTAK